MSTPSTSESPKCPHCKKCFTLKSNLKRHLVKIHKIEQGNPDRKFQCNACNSSFKEARNLNYHKRKVHGDTKHLKVKQHSCSICGELVASQNLTIHLQTVHDVKIDTIQKEFASYQDFLTWKADFEKKEKCKFVQLRGVKEFNKEKHYSFVCHRSGYFKSKGKGVKNLKIQGSCKMNTVCPAAMKIKEHNDSGKCKLNFTNTHIGHQMDLGHLTLSEAERQMIAEKIALKLPFDAILEDVHNSISEENLERRHLLRKKDLHNIAKSFNLTSEAVYQPNDKVSVKTRVKKKQKRANSHALFYKLQGEENQLSSFKAPGIISISDSIEIVEESDSGKNAINQELSKNNPFLTSSLNDELMSLNSQWERIINLIKTVDDCNLVKIHLKSLETVLSDTHATVKSFQTNHPSTSSNKSILPQRHLFSIRKQKKKREKVIVKPSIEEEQEIAVSVILNHDLNNV